MPCVSVIVPTFNAEAFIERCVRMLQDQSLSDIEILFVDDCSSDDTVERIEHFARDDSRIRLIRFMVNQGPGSARNAAIEVAAGKFLTFLDVDDRYGSNQFLESLYCSAVSLGTQVSAACFCNELPFGRIEDNFDQADAFWGYTLQKDGLVTYDNYQFDYGFHRFMFSRELFSNGANRFPDLRFYEDPVFLVDVMHQAKVFSSCSNQRYLYRCRYRKEHWTTEKVLDFLDGVTQNLHFSKVNELALLHWATLNHLECETSRLGIGCNWNLDLPAIDTRLRALEESIDSSLLDKAFAQGKTKGLHSSDLLIRRELDQAILRNGRTSFAKKLHHGLSSSALWYHLRLLIK